MLLSLWLVLAAWNPALAESLRDTRLDPVIRDIQIRVNSPAGQEDRLRSLALSLVTVASGRPLSSQDLVSSLEALKKSGLFKAIHVPDPAPAPGPDGVILLIELTPNDRIRDIEVTGAFPVLEGSIEKAMTLKVGGVYDPLVLENQKTLIKNELRSQGYPDSRVTISADPRGTGGVYDITIIIDKGESLHLGKVTFSGNKSVSDTRLKFMTQVWKASCLFGGARRFRAKQVDQDIRTLISFYRSSGFYDAAVTSKIQPGASPLDRDITFEVQEGPRYNIRFSGNKAFWDTTLKKLMVLETRGNADDIGLTVSRRNIQDKYMGAGYPDVTVAVKKVEETRQEKGVRTIEFLIREGIKYRVDSIEFKGNTSFSNDDLGGLIRTETAGMFRDGAYVPSDLEQDLGAIQGFYAAHGYPDAHITVDTAVTRGPTGDENLVSLVYKVHEGTRVQVNSVKLEGLTVISREKALKILDLKPGIPLNPAAVKENETRLSEAVSENGFPYNTVSTISEPALGTEGVDLTYRVEEGQHVTMGQVVAVGNTRTRPSVFSRAAEQKPGTPFSLKKLLETERNIRNINSLESTDFRVMGLKEGTGTVNLLAEVEEKRPYFVQASVGYDSDTRANGNFTLGDHNLLGFDIGSQARAGYSETGHSGGLSLTRNDFWGTGTDVIMDLSTETSRQQNTDFEVRSNTGTVTLSRNLFPHTQGLVSFRYENRKQYGGDAGCGDTGDTGCSDSRSIITLNPSLTYDTKDSFLRPTKGIKALFQTTQSYGLTSDLDTFVKAGTDLKYYFTPMNRLTFALRGRYDQIFSTGGSTDVPEDQLFFLGGTTTVRGFETNLLRHDSDGSAVGGKCSVLGSLEARIDLGMNVEFTGFFDTGSICDSGDSQGSDGFRSSVGLGFRYVTPIGSIGFLYGWKLDRQPGETAGAFHFSVGYTF
ncbi:MAG: outer membrane protein assembly factor BamA [Pseudomonadota bacterium]